MSLIELPSVDDWDIHQVGLLRVWVCFLRGILLGYVDMVGILIKCLDLFQSMPEGTNGALQVGSIRDIKSKSFIVMHRTYIVQQRLINVKVRR